MNLNDDVVDRCRWLAPLHQPHPGRSRSLVRHYDRFHLRHLSVSVLGGCPRSTLDNVLRKLGRVPEIGAAIR
jgi:hypothetical protein